MQTTPLRPLAVLVIGLGALGLTACTTGPSDQTTAQACAILTDARADALASAEKIGATIGDDPIGAATTAVRLVFDATTALGSISNSSIKPVADSFGEALSAASDDIATLAQDPASISVNSFSTITAHLAEASDAVTAACGS